MWRCYEKLKSDPIVRTQELARCQKCLEFDQIWSNSSIFRLEDGRNVSDMVKSESLVQILHSIHFLKKVYFVRSALEKIEGRRWTSVGLELGRGGDRGQTLELLLLAGITFTAFELEKYIFNWNASSIWTNTFRNSDIWQFFGWIFGQRGQALELHYKDSLVMEGSYQ